MNASLKNIFLIETIGQNAGMWLQLLHMVWEMQDAQEKMAILSAKPNLYNTPVPLMLIFSFSDDETSLER